MPASTAITVYLVPLDQIHDPGRCRQFLQEERSYSHRSKDVSRGKTFAVLASLVNTAKLNSVDPEVWLVDVLERIISGKVKASEMESLLPWTWKAEREAMTQQERRAA